MRTNRSLLPTLLALGSLFGCGDGASEDAPAAALTPEAPEPTPGESGQATDEAPDSDATPAPSTPPVDLLHAVGTELAVSTAYRDDAEQPARMVDGELPTAWNSRSGDLVGAWFEVRIPEGATVSGLEMTAGFVKEGSRTDLFTGNHRVTRVRVSRDGTSLGEFALDPALRTLQPIAASGPAGVYRVEVLETLAGSRDDWREICISEVRVMGHAPDATPGARTPRVGIGTLPAPRVAAPPADPAAFASALEGAVVHFVRVWDQAGREYAESLRATGDTDFQDAESARLRGMRRRAFGRVADVLEPVNPSAADRLRAAGAERQQHATVLVDAVAPVVAEHGDAALRCTWAKLAARTHIVGLLAPTRANDVVFEIEEMTGAFTREERLQFRAEQRAAGVLRRTGAALRRGDSPPSAPLREHDLTHLSSEHWTGLLAGLDGLATACPAEAAE